MKRSLILFTAALACAVSCGTAGQYAEAGRFQDGIYYKPDPRGGGAEPATEDVFVSRAALDNYALRKDSVTVATDDFDQYGCYPWWGWRPYSLTPYHWGPWHWGYYQHWGYSYWGYPYYWDCYGWYDPFCWDYPYWYYGYPYPHYYYHAGYYSWHDGGHYTRRVGSATSGVYSHPGHVGTPGAVRSVPRMTGSRTASAAAQRDLDRLNTSRTAPRTTAVNREPVSPEIQNYRRAGATRTGSSASSYNGSRDTGAYRYDSSSRQTAGTRSSSGWGGGGSSRSSGSSHAGGSSHSSGGSYHGGGGRR